MNHIHCVLWSIARQSWVAAPETGKGRSKSSARRTLRRSFVPGVLRLSCLALACTAALDARAANYVAANETQLRQAILDANADGDPSSTITLGGNISLTNAAAFPTSVKPLTINTSTFTMSAASAAASTSFPGSLTLVNGGTVQGGVQGGTAITLTSGGRVENSGLIQGAASTNNGGTAVSATGATVIVNAAGVVRGGDTSSASGLAVIGSGISGTNLNIIVEGTVEGGLRTATGVRGFAINTTNSVLELRAGYNIVGSVRGIGGTFVLGGTSDSSLSASNIGFPSSWTGFTSYRKTGSSTWTLTGTANTTTSWQLLEGTLRVSSNGALGTAPSTLTFDGGTLRNDTAFSSARSVTINGGGGTYQTDADLTWSGVIGGAGGLTKTGVATLFMAGNNTYGGTTTIAAGTLQVGDGGTAGSLGTGGVINNGALVLNRADAVTVGNVVTGAGSLAQAGTGNLILASVNTYTGNTFVNAGTLSINGSIAASAVTVNNSGTLGGNGTTGSVSVASGGTLAPGNSIGTLTVNGNITFAAGSTYRIEVDAAGANDRINATGTAAINGGTVDVQAGAGTYQASTQYTILNAAGGRTGTFTGVTSNLAFLTPTLGYDANNVFLTLARNDISFASVALTPNQIAASTALQNAGGSGDMGTVQNALMGLSAVQARAAYDATSGAGIVELRRAAARFGTNFGSRLQARLGAVQNQGTSVLANSFGDRPLLLAANDTLSDLMAPISDAPQQKFSLGGNAPVLSARSDAVHGLWLRGYGSNGNTDGDGNAAASRLRSSGLSFGFDTEVKDGVRIGVAATGGTSRLSTDNNETGKARGSALAAYGSYATGLWSFSGSTSMGWGKNHMERNITVGGLNRVASSNFDSNTLSAYGEAAYSLPMNGWTLLPLAGLALSRYKADGFTETGAGALNLQAADQTINSSKSMLGTKASFDTGRIRFEPRVIWVHEFGDLNTPMTAQFQGAATASPFQVSGATLKRDTLILGLGASGSISKGVDLFADVQAEHNANQRNFAVLMGLRSRW